MIKKVVLFNDHGIGDLIWSRNIARYISSYLQDYEIKCFFYHKYNKAILKFDKNIVVGSYREIIPYISKIDYRGFYPIHCPNFSITYDDTLYVNTWLLFSRSYLDNYHKDNNEQNIPQNLVNFDTLSLLANDIIKIIEKNCNISIPKSTGNLLITDCIKENSKYHEIDNFFNNQKFSKYVLISNGNSRSGQTENFDIYDWMKPVIEKYQDCAFIFTEKNFTTNLRNVLTTSNFPNIQSLDNIEYMSTKCSILFTRSSGPGHIFFNKDNCFNKDKTIIAYTKHRNTAFLCDTGTCNYVWSNIFTQQNLIENFDNILSKK